MSQTIKFFRLDKKPATPGIRPMEDKDVPAVTALLNNYLKKFAVAPVFDEEETRHHLSMRDGVVYTWWRTRTSGENHRFRVILLAPSTVIQSSGGHSTLRAAYSVLQRRG